LALLLDVVVEFRFVGDGDPLRAADFSVPQFVVDSPNHTLFSCCRRIEDEDIWIRMSPRTTNPVKLCLDRRRVDGIRISWFRWCADRDVGDTVATTGTPAFTCPLEFTAGPTVTVAVWVEDKPSRWSTRWVPLENT
jgi:hypothetical protein